MPDLNEHPLKFRPRGVSDTVDGDNSPPGSCMSLSNLLFAPDTPNVLVCRPANLKLTDFGSLGSVNIAVGATPFAMAITPDGTKLLVVNSSAGTVSVIDTATNTVSATVTVGNSPRGIAITPDGTKAYVTNYNDSTITQITVSTNATSTFAMGVFRFPWGIVIDPSGTNAYVTSRNAGEVWFFPVATNTFSATTIPTGINPQALAITPDGTKLYVANNSDRSVTRITLPGFVTSTILLPVSALPWAITVSPDNLKVFVSDVQNNTVSIIDVLTNLIINVISVGSVPTSLAINLAGTILYVANLVDNTLTKIILSTGVRETIVNSFFSGSFVILVTNLALYVGNTTTNTVTVLGFSNVVSAAYRLGNIIYGLVGSATTSGKDTPFAYNVVTATFQTVTGITVANTPATQPTSGAWTPPTADMVGTRIIFTHPGFNFSAGYAFGYFDISGFTATPTGDTHNASKVITNVSALGTAGIGPGYTITGTDIPAGSTVTDVDPVANTITISQNMTGSTAGVTLTIAGGTAASPLWAAGNTMYKTKLAGVANSVAQFNNRAWFGQANFLVFTDTLSLNISNTSAVQVLTIGDTSPIIGLCGLPEYTTSGGVLQALIVFKAAHIEQITGDAATSNLVQNSIGNGVGSSAGRSIVQTPEGIMFMANDGIRQVNLVGQVTEPNQDLAVPFIFAVQPSRVAAAYNSDIYRICTQNGNPLIPGAPYQGYYYELKRKAWTGPHTFRDDLMVPYNNDFITFSNDIPGTMWQSFSVQGHQNIGNTFVENGQQLTWNYTTCPMTDLENMYANCAVRSTLQMALPSTGDTYQFQASDQALGALATAQLTAFSSEAIWLAFNWGDGTLWGAVQFGLKPQIIPWTQALIFNKLVAQASGNSSLGLKLGSWFFGYKRLNYLMQ